MLSTVLTSLQTLISGRFVVAAFFPMLAFVISNCAALVWLNEPARGLAMQMMEASTAKSTLLVLVVLIATAMVAYIFSALLPVFQLVLEGRWPAWLVSLFVPVQVRQLEALEKRRLDNDTLRAGLENPRGIDGWPADLDVPRGKIIRPANNAGNFIFICSHAGRSGPNQPAFPQNRGSQVNDGTVVWKNVGASPDVELPIPQWKLRLREARTLGLTAGHNTFTEESDAAKEVEKLEKLRRQNRPISYDALESTVNRMVEALMTNNADDPQHRVLELTRSRLRQLIDYAADTAYSEDLRLTNELRFNFGAQSPAPTLMGNIANTIQSYAERCYKLNFEIFWSRMQRAIQRDKEFGPVLQQSKMQLDFLISCSVLTAIWSLIWMAVSFLLGMGWQVFLFSAVAGPLIAYFWYRGAVAQYRTFADVLRTSIDLFRFDLLTDLHIALPGDPAAEQALWDTLHRIHSYYEPQPLHYQHTKST